MFSYKVFGGCEIVNYSELSLIAVLVWLFFFGEKIQVLWPYLMIVHLTNVENCIFSTLAADSYLLSRLSHGTAIRELRVTYCPLVPKLDIFNVNDGSLQRKSRKSNFSTDFNFIFINYFWPYKFIFVYILEWLDISPIQDK